MLLPTGSRNVEFGVRVFSECCALESVGNIVDGGSHLAIGAIISQYAFEECAKLAHLSLPHVRAVVDSSTLTSPQAGLPQGCFFASGIQQVELGDDTYHIGHRALENCKDGHTYPTCAHVCAVPLPVNSQAAELLA